MIWRVVVILGTIGLVSCVRPVPEEFAPGEAAMLEAGAYYDAVYGAWQSIMVANHTGLVHEGKYLDEPGAGESVNLVLLEQWSTDDDTMIEWIDLHILEAHGLTPTYAAIRDEWVEHINHDIWVSTRAARTLMDAGVLPPETGSAELNPEGAWSIDAQLQTELFGLLAPGMPEIAARQAAYFARVTNSGPAVEVSEFYATLYALAFFEKAAPEEIAVLIRRARGRVREGSTVAGIVDNVMEWHRAAPDDWRWTREQIRLAYDHDPMWWASRVNFASTIMALLYGEGDWGRTLSIACLGGWDADNNATTPAGLLGVLYGYRNLPPAVRNASDIYYNEDGTGDLPKFERVSEIAARTQRLAEAQIEAAGGRVVDGRYFIVTKPESQ